MNESLIVKEILLTQFRVKLFIIHSRNSHSFVVLERAELKQLLFCCLRTIRTLMAVEFDE